MRNKAIKELLTAPKKNKSKLSTIIFQTDEKRYKRLELVCLRSGHTKRFILEHALDDALDLLLEKYKTFRG